MILSLLIVSLPQYILSLSHSDTHTFNTKQLCTYLISPVLKKATWIHWLFCRRNMCLEQHIGLQKGSRRSPPLVLWLRQIPYVCGALDFLYMHQQSLWVCMGYLLFISYILTLLANIFYQNGDCEFTTISIYKSCYVLYPSIYLYIYVSYLV